jgi:predicted PurR-regulated permease PerM
MDWTQALTIIFSTVGFVLVLFIYLMSRMDNKFEQLLNRMDSKFDAMNTRFNSLENRLTALEAETKSELRNINQRLSNIENCIMPRKVFHFQETHKEEEPKEN